jgi:hypothetical protein
LADCGERTRKRQGKQVPGYGCRWSCAVGLLAWLKAQAERYCGGPVQIASIYEAGLDGFCVHRLLEANGVESHVVDAASIAVDRRSRRAKTERIDVEKLLRTLMGWARGERRICWMVRPLSPIDEDERPAGIRHCHPCSRLTSSRDTARVAPIANRRSQCFRALKEERYNERVVAKVPSRKWWKREGDVISGLFNEP